MPVALQVAQEALQLHFGVEPDAEVRQLRTSTKVSHCRTLGQGQAVRTVIEQLQNYCREDEILSFQM